MTTLSIKHKQSIRKGMKRFYVNNPEARDRVRKQMTGTPAKGCCFDNHKDDNNPVWMGDKVSYSALHSWLRRKLGNPKICEHCNKIGMKVGRRWNLEWANKYHVYKRNLTDWMGLCDACHKKYDRKFFN